MSTKNIYQRMHEVMETVTYVRKEKGGMQYSSVSHDAVTAKLRSACHKAGIIITQSVFGHRLEGNNTICDVVVTLTNIDDPKDSIAINSFGYGIDKQDKGPGKAMSYAFKYALLKAFMLETGDDPDRDPKTPDRQGGETKILDNDAQTYQGTPAHMKRAEELCEQAGIIITKDLNEMLMGQPVTDVKNIIEDYAHGDH